MTTITGTGGELKCKWQQAAVLSSWTITKDTSIVLTATVVNANFWASQRPLTFVARSMSWPIESLQIEGASLTATLGPRSPEHGPANPTS
jgi:hypothetical protein